MSSLEEVKLSLLILSVSSNCCCWSINLSFCHKNTLHKSTLSPLFCVTRPDCKVQRARRQVLTPLPPLPTCFLSLCPSYPLISPQASLFFSKSNVIPPPPSRSCPQTQTHICRVEEADSGPSCMFVHRSFLGGFL